MRIQSRLSRCARTRWALQLANTFISDAMCLKDYFLFPHVGRMDDIWAAYYLQAKGYRAVWPRHPYINCATRTILFAIWCKSIWAIENNLKLVQDLARDPESMPAYLPGRSNWAFQLYRRHSIMRKVLVTARPDCRAAYCEAAVGCRR